MQSNFGTGVLIGVAINFILMTGIWTATNNRHDSIEYNEFNNVRIFIENSNSDIKAKTIYTCLRRKITNKTIDPIDLVDLNKLQSEYLAGCLTYDK